MFLVAWRNRIRTTQLESRVTEGVGGGRWKCSGGREKIEGDDWKGF